MPPSEIPPSTESDTTEPTNIRDAPAEITRGKAAGSEVVTITILILSCNDCNILI